MIVDAGDSLNSMMGKNDLSRDAIATLFGKDQVTSLLMISENLKNNNTLAEDMKKTAEENLQSLRNFEETKKKFYESYAPEIHAMVTKWLPMIAGGALAVGGVRRIGGLVRGNQIPSTGRLSAAQGAAAMNMARGGRAYQLGARAAPILGGLGRVAGFLGPIGIGVSVMSIGIPLLVKLFKSNADNTKELAEEARRKKHLAVRRNLADDARLAANLIQSLNVRHPDANEGKDILRVMKGIEANTGKTKLKTI